MKNEKGKMRRESGEIKNLFHFSFFPFNFSFPFFLFNF